MSRENVEVVRRGWDAWIRGDMDALFETFHPAVEWDTTSFEGWPENDVYRGHDGVLTVFPDYTIEVEELRDLGDATLSRFRARGHGAASETPLVDPAWHAIKWRDGKCVWWRVCSTEAEALEAVRLHE